MSTPESNPDAPNPQDDRVGQTEGQDPQGADAVEPVVLPEAPPLEEAAEPEVPVDPAPADPAPADPAPAPEAATQPQASNVPPAPPAPAPQAAAAQQSAAAPQAQQQPFPQVLAKPQGRLSTFLKVSIILLAALSIAAIALVFIGDFEGKVERITATFLIFAVFVGLTAADTSRGSRNSWYAPVALIANSYILALLLIVTWMSEGDYFLGWNIFWKSILVIGVTRAVVGCCQLLIGMGEGKPEPLSRFAFVTSVLAVLSGILFTAPLAIEVFDITVPELYWKIAVATLLLTALGLAISLLLRWSYGSQDREARRAAQAAQAAQARAAQQAQQAHQPQQVALQPQPIQQPVQPAASGPLLPWPRFADGRPLPVGPDGQPDFSVPGAPRPPHLP